MFFAADGRSVALCGACFQRHAVPAAEAAEEDKARTKTKPKVNTPSPRFAGSSLGDGAFKKVKPTPLRLGGRSDGRALNRSLPFT